jgi:hypothetical protein
VGLALLALLAPCWPCWLMAALRTPEACHLRRSDPLWQHEVKCCRRRL